MRRTDRTRRRVVTLYGTGFQQVDVYLDGQLSETRMMNFG